MTLKKYPVAELIKEAKLIIGDGYRAKNEELSSAGLPFARVSNIEQGFNFSKCDFFPVENINIVGNKTSRVGDIVFTSKGTVGRFAFVTPQTERFVYSPQLCFWRVVDQNIIYPRYLFYWMQGREFFLQYNGVKGQTDMADYVSLSDQRMMHISLPTIEKQQHIAGILGSLDDKIELNQRMNCTLESMARAVFEEMMRSSDGRTVAIGDVVQIVGGSTPSTANPDFWVNGSISWATPKDLASLKEPILLGTNSKITQHGLGQISSGLLPAGTVLLSSRAPIGYLAITQIPVAINQGFIAIKCTEEAPNYFILNWLTQNMDEVIGRANGTTFLEINKANFRSIQIQIPPQKRMVNFINYVEPIYQKIISNLIETQLLAQTRELILPPLLNGSLTM